MPVKVYGQSDVDCLLDYLAFTPDVVMNGVKEYYCVYGFKWSLLSFLGQGKYLVRYTAYRRVRYGYAVYVLNVV